MEFNIINVLDLMRFMLGLIASEYVFFDSNCTRRRNYHIKFIGGALLLSLGCLSYFPIEHLGWSNSIVAMVVMAIWWTVFSLATLPYMYLCYEVGFGVLLFYYIFANVLQETITVIVRYCIVGVWMPDLPVQHTGIYLILMLAIYAICLVLTHRFFAQKIVVTEEERFFEQPFFLASQILLIFVFAVLQDVTSGMFACIVQNVSEDAKQWIYQFVMPYYIIGLLMVFCIVVGVFMILIYRIVVLNQSKIFMENIYRQKEQQYAATRENIDIINQKCHDLKHQLKAMRMANDAQREQLYQETKAAITFYDATVHTGNEVIDTILTDKSLVCSTHQIKLSCNVSVHNLDFINVVDLYTLLGNAIDNAIEAVSDYSVEKRIISLWIKEQGDMLHFMVDNYFEGTLVLKNGYPVTSKEDKDYHGFGIKSIRMTAKKYRGEIRISQDGTVFSLQIMIPKDMH